jgi:hypothetical protein
MAPERFALEAGPASDVFSLGCILWLGLTGQHFFGEARAFVEVASLARSDAGWDELLGGWPETGLAELDDLARSMVARRVEDRPTASEVAARCELLVDRFADRVRLGEWCRVRWPDGVSVPLPAVAERTASSLAEGGAQSADEEATEATERAAPLARSHPASLADVAPTEIAPRAPTPPRVPRAVPDEPRRQRSAAPLALAVLALTAILGFAVVAGGGVLGAALYTAGPASAPGSAAEATGSTATGTVSTATARANPDPADRIVPADPVVPAAPSVPAEARPHPAAPDGPSPVPTKQVRSPPAPVKSTAEVRAMVGRRLDELVPALKSCGSGAKGRWLLTFTVAPAGGTGGVALSALERPNAAIEACVAGRVADWRFDPVPAAQPVSRTLRFP